MTSTLVVTTALILGLLFPLATVVAFHLTIHSPRVSRFTPNINIIPRGNARSLLLFVHFDDFSDLIKNNDEPIRNGKANGEDRSIQSSSQSSFPRLRSTLASPPISYPPCTCSNILELFTSSGFVDDNDILQFARGFISREEVLSQILIRDFGWKALDAHRARVGLVSLARAEFEETIITPIIAEQAMPTTSKPTVSTVAELSLMVLPKKTVSELKDEQKEANNTTEIIKPVPWKSVLVNDKASIRRAKGERSKTQQSSARKDNNSSDSVSIRRKDSSYNYGLLQVTTDTKDRQIYGNLYAEMDNFWSYMTVPQTSAVSDPTIREQTAKVYMSHCRLFLGWVVDARGVLTETDLLEDLQSMKEGGDSDETYQRPVSPLADSTSSGMAILQTASSPADAADSARIQAWKNVLQRISSAQSTSDSQHLQNNERGYVKQSISLYDIFPTSQTESAASILQYILWLRSERGVSPNYEANILRGLIKLVKFRFAHEMSSSSSSSLSMQSSNQKHGAGAAASTRSTALDHLPIVIELRKLHREAGSKGKKAPRSSDEGKKWLDWSEYLEVIQLLKSDLSEMISKYDSRLQMEEREEIGSEDDQTGSDKAREKQKASSLARSKSLKAQKKDIASTFQRYLILSFFACVPDRQRTYRELQLGRSFIKVNTEEDGGSIWVIKHTAEDYKTGSTYGERPPLPLTESLTPDIDDFIQIWRPALLRSPPNESTTDKPSSHLFLQPRTGNPLTANSVYQIVSRCCYKYKQKKTNPHLLRDMIVTHVRKNADASEKELEALALFMGHSIHMQRESYDRRTLEQKVSPAVKLMQNMNSLGSDMTR